MLLNFRVDNGTSYHDGAFLSLEAEPITGHEGSLIHQGNISILPVATIYGANGAGKTNLLRLMESFCYYVVNSVDIKSNSKMASRYPFMPFNYCKDPKSATVEYEVTFLIGEREYRYTLALGISEVQEETLEFKKDTGKSSAFLNVFSRQGKELKIGSSEAVKKEEPNISFCNSMLTDKDLLLTALGRRAQADAPEIGIPFYAIYKWFEKITYVENTSNQRRLLSIQEGSPEEAFYSSRVATKYARLADPQIHGLSLAKLAQFGQETLALFSEHEMIDSDETKLVPSVAESKGTQNLLKAAPVIQRALDEGGLLLADELDGSMHPLLLLEIIKMFMDPEQNPHHAQLICTLHNVVIMDRRNLRRDSIWFVDKDEKGVSELYSLADIMINGAMVRNDADFCKNYVLGNYGATPSFENREEDGQ